MAPRAIEMDLSRGKLRHLKQAQLIMKIDARLQAGTDPIAWADAALEKACDPAERR